MKKKNLFSRMLLLFALIVGSTSNAWATPTTYNFSSIPTTGWSTSGGNKTINNISWSYSSSTYIGASASNIQIGSKNNPQTNNWTIQTAITNFGNNKAVTAVSITASTTATTATYDISVGGTSVKSGSLTTSSATYSATGLNVTSGNIVVTLKGSSTSKAMYLSNISVTYDDATTDPVISASDVEISADATSGEFSYSISNSVASTDLAASVSSGESWLSNATVVPTNATSGKVTFITTANEDDENARVGTIHLVYGNNLATKDITITQAKAPKKYAVTIEQPTGGTLVVKNGNEEIVTGTKVAVGTTLTIVPTADATHIYKNWQYKKGTGDWVTRTTDFTYTMDNNDVSFRANFDPTYAVNWSVNGTIISTTRFAQGATIAFPEKPVDIDGRTFVGWIAETITGTTNETPNFITSATMGTSDLTYYAVFAEAEGSGEEVETKTQTLQYDTWTYFGTTTDKNSYRLFGNGSYIESASFDLSKLSKVIVYGGTFGGDSYKNLTIDDGTNVWRSVSVSGSSQTGENVYNSTGATALSGTKKLHITSKSGNGTSNGIRISKVEIYTLEGGYTYSNYCTTVAPDERLAVNMTGFAATETTLVVGATTNTTVTNDQSGWTAAYTYESDNTDVATVDASGVVTAVAKGTANITATLNVSKDDPDYKAGETKSKSIEITVVKPSHNVTFSVNGTATNPVAVEEGETIEFPAVENINGYAFVGWLTAAIDGIAESANSVSAATMGNADITYYAAFGQSEKKNVTATFDASDISNLEETATLTWRDKATGIVMYISNGLHYQGSNTNPAAWNVTKSTSTNDYYMSIGKADCALKKIEVTVTGSDYAFGDYYAYTYVTDETGSDLTSDVTNEGNVYSWVLNDSYEQVILWSGYSYQVRATKIVVDALTTIATGVCTTVPTSATVAITSAKYATYSSAYPLDFTNTGVTAYIVTAKKDAETVTMTPITKVPSKTGIVLYAETADSYDIPVLTGDADEFETNYLHAHLTAGEPVVDGDYYILAIKDGNVGFYKSDGGVLAANRAYLVLPDSSGAPSFSFDFGGGTTGIGATLNDNGEMINDKVYDLSGRRVAQPTKGIYIINGKKVVVK